MSNAQRASLIPRKGVKRSGDRIERPMAGLETRVRKLAPRLRRLAPVIVRRCS